MPSLPEQVVWLFVLAITIASASWTVTHEEVFREMRDYCERRGAECRTVVARKLFYLFTREYCFSHYVTLFFVLLTGYRLLMADWRGYLVAFLALVWIANAYMGLFGLLRVDMRAGRAEADVHQKEAEKITHESRRIQKETEKIQ